MADTARFSIGDIVFHKRFDYRGVVYDVDPHFMQSEEWYQHVAKSQPPKDQPWYHVLVHNSIQETYVAERHLETDDSRESINHPLVEDLFDAFEGDHYSVRNKSN